jgi:hypothetical protein
MGSPLVEHFHLERERLCSCRCGVFNGRATTGKKESPKTSQQPLTSDIILAHFPFLPAPIFDGLWHKPRSGVHSTAMQNRLPNSPQSQLIQTNHCCLKHKRNRRGGNRTLRAGKIMQVRPTHPASVYKVKSEARPTAELSAIFLY